MASSLGYFILLIIVYSYWKKQHRQVARIEFCSSIFALRDKTRRLAIDKKVDPESWVFQYYDLSFSKTVKHSDQLSLAAILFSIIFNKTEPGFSKFNAKLKQELEHNPELKQINSEYIQIVVNYLFAQELPPKNIFTILVRPFAFIKARFMVFIQNLNANTEFTVADRYAY